MNSVRKRGSRLGLVLECGILEIVQMCVVGGVGCTRHLFALYFHVWACTHTHTHTESQLPLILHGYF